MPGHDFGRVFAGEQYLPGEHLAGHTGQAVDVRRGYGRPSQISGAMLMRRAQHDPAGAQATRFGSLDQIEIGQGCAFPGADEQVVGLDIAVGEAVRWA
jgi:hypothetical protein